MYIYIIYVYYYNFRQVCLQGPDVYTLYMFTTTIPDKCVYKSLMYICYICFLLPFQTSVFTRARCIYIIYVYYYHTRQVCLQEPDVYILYMFTTTIPDKCVYKSRMYTYIIYVYYYNSRQVCLQGPDVYLYYICLLLQFQTSVFTRAGCTTRGSGGMTAVTTSVSASRLCLGSSSVFQSRFAVLSQQHLFFFVCLGCFGLFGLFFVCVKGGGMF